MKKQRIRLILIVLFSTIAACVSEQRMMPFRMQETCYQSWVANAEESGTNLWIKVSHVKSDVVFDSVVFRGWQMPVCRADSGRFILLQAMIPSEKMKQLHKLRRVNEPNQLQFIHKNERKNILLKNIRRKEMKYF